MNQRVPLWRGLRISSAGAVLVICGFVAGIATDRLMTRSSPSTAEPADAVPAFSDFWQAWDLVKQHYVDQSAVDPTRMTYGAIEGMLDSLGDVGHTRFLSPDDVSAEQQALSGQLEGIGAEVSLRDGHPVIVAPLPNSPAQQAGLKAGDAIIRVDGQDVAALPVEQVVRLVRGPAGTSVTLTIVHQGESDLQDLTIERQQVTVPSVQWARLPGTPVAHLLVTEFSSGAGAQLRQAIDTAAQRVPRRFFWICVTIPAD